MELRRLIFLGLLFVGATPLSPPAPTSANFSWDWTQATGTTDIAGFKLSLGTAPNTYSRTIDIPDKTARTFIATGLDLTKINYAILQSYTSFGIVSAATPELTYGGAPSAPFRLGASPTN